MTRAPALVAASHGTSSAEGSTAVAALVDRCDVRRRSSWSRTRSSTCSSPRWHPFSTTSAPRTQPWSCRSCSPREYHVHVDLAREVANAAGLPALGAALGPDDRLVDVLADRLAEAGLRGDDRIVLAAAGSSDVRAVDDCRVVSRRLAGRLGRPVAVGFLSAARPALADAIARTRATHPVSRVVVSSYLLAPGYFHDLAGAAGGDVDDRAGPASGCPSARRARRARARPL